MLYALLIIAHYRATQPDFIIKKVIVEVWHYQRKLSSQESLLVAKHTALPAFKPKEIIDKAHNFLTNYFKEEIRVVGIEAARVEPELSD